MPWTQTERATARKVLEVISSDKYKAYNLLFLLPFDLAQVPGYLEEVGKPLDLQTVRTNLESDKYDGPEQFWSDVRAIFDNAIKYHGKRTQTKWIAKSAKEMVKILTKERKALDPTMAAGGGGGSKNKPKVKLKLSTGGSSKSSSSEQQKKNKASPAAAATTKKPKLKLKLSTKAAVAATDATLLSSSAGAPAPAGSAAKKASTNKPTAVKAKPTQPKLKLKLSLNKNKAASAAAGTSATATTSTASAATTSAAGAKPKTTSKASGGGGPKIQLKMPGRGKELPQGVKAADSSSTSKKKSSTNKASTKKASTATSSSKKTGAASSADKNSSGSKASTKSSSAAASAPSAAPSSTSSSKAHAAAVGVPGTTTLSSASAAASSSLSVQLVPACYKVILGLKRREHGDISWFLQPVSDKAIIADYKAKIPHPMDMTTLQNKLDAGKYTDNPNNVVTFVRDVRRIFSNALRYNTSIKDSLRPVAVKVVATAEDLLAQFLLAVPGAKRYPPLLWCWKLCIEILDTLYNLVGADGQPVALYFLHPVSYYCGGQFPPDYRQKISKPMDFGSVTADLLEGRYQFVEQFANDCRLVISNCLQYYEGRDRW